MIKFFVALSSIFYPLICVQTAAAGNWKINIVIPLVLSCVVLVIALIARFVYDDEKAANAGAGNEKRADQAEIDAAKARQLVAPGKFTAFLTYFYACLLYTSLYL